jgi:hypothetical protein
MFSFSQTSDLMQRVSVLIKELSSFVLSFYVAFDLPRCRWMDNIKMDLLGIGLNVVDWKLFAKYN